MLQQENTRPVISITRWEYSRHNLLSVLILFLVCATDSARAAVTFSTTTNVRSKFGTSNLQEDPTFIQFGFGGVTGFARATAKYEPSTRRGRATIDFRGYYSGPFFGTIWQNVSMSSQVVVSGFSPGTNVYFWIDGDSGFAYINDIDTFIVGGPDSYSGVLSNAKEYVLSSASWNAGFNGEFSYGLGIKNRSIHSEVQFSLSGPVGSQQSPIMQVLQGLPYNDESEPAQQAEIVTGYQLGFGLEQSGLGRDDFLWTSSNPADLLPAAGAAARALAVNPTELELVYDITGPRVTAIIFDALLSSIVPTLVLEIGGLDVPVTLGQEIDLTQYDPLGLNRFNLHISGISDWSALPNDWFLTGYKFAGPGEVRVITRAVPEVGSWALMSVGLGLLGVLRATRSARSRK
jgi:hypothetical protein